MSRLEKFKEKVEMDETYYQKLYQFKKKSEEISEEMQKALEKNNFLKDYAFFCIDYPYAE